MLLVTFPGRNDIQPILMQLPVGRQSDAERILRNAYQEGWRGFYLHPEAVGPMANEMDLCGVNPKTGDHDFLVMNCLGDGGVEEIPR